MLGAQGDFWEKQHFDLEKYNGANKDYEVVIEAQVGNGHLGDIAIDDITLSRGCSKALFDLPGHLNASIAPPSGNMAVVKTCTIGL